MNEKRAKKLRRVIGVRKDRLRHYEPVPGTARDKVVQVTQTLPDGSVAMPSATVRTVTYRLALGSPEQLYRSTKRLHATKWRKVR